MGVEFYRGAVRSLVLHNDQGVESVSVQRFGNLLFLVLVVSALGLIVWGGTRPPAAISVGENVSGAVPG
jgi:hypothetical protein